jgi:hypothetical protein
MAAGDAGIGVHAVAFRDDPILGARYAPAKSALG